MEKGVCSDLFVNDGSFMEKFKQLQQEKEKASAGVTTSAEEAKSASPSLVLKPNSTISKITLNSTSSTSNGGKLAFSLKQKSKLAVVPVQLGADDDENEVDTGKGLSDGQAKRQKTGPTDESESSSLQEDVAPPPPIDPMVKKVADKLASFVAKNGRQFEHITRQRNPGDTPFKFLFDIGCADYKYYEHRLIEEEKLLAQTKEFQASRSACTSNTSSRSSSNLQRGPFQQNSNYQIPASALYESNEEPGAASFTNSTSYGDVSGPAAEDPIAKMEFFMKKAAREERMRGPKQSKDEMPPPAYLQAPMKKGHHMGDFIPPEELEKFLASCNDAAAQRACKEAVERARIQADNVGHKLLSKMGWREGEGLGSSRSGRADPVMAGNVKLNNLGVGAETPGEVTPADDIYEQYKKRMMLGYRFRPNPMNNPRKAYY